MNQPSAAGTFTGSVKETLGWMFVVGSMAAMFVLGVETKKAPQIAPGRYQISTDSKIVYRLDTMTGEVVVISVLGVDPLTAKPQKRVLLMPEVPSIYVGGH